MDILIGVLIFVAIVGLIVAFIGDFKNDMDGY